MSVTAEGARGRLRFFAFVIAFAFLVLGAWTWWEGRENLREGSRVTSEGGAPLRIDEAPTTYHAVFRVENRARDELVVTEERVWFRRPFDSRIETWRGSKLLSTRHSAFGVLTNEGSGSGAPLNITVPPSIATGDLRIDAIVEEAVEAKTVLRRERREVYGRECQVYRAGGPVLAGDLVKYEGGKGTYADVCVDRNGIVIEEYWVDDGRPLRRRVATELEVNEPIGNKVFAIDVPEDPDFNRGAVERIDEDAPLEGTPLWTLSEAPKGFDKIGRYGVVIAPQALPQTNDLVPASAQSTSEVYVRGPDLIVVDQDPSLARLVTLEGRQTTKVDLGDLKDGLLIVDARMSEVRGRTGDGSVVRVFGTVEPSMLVELARGLRPTENR